MAILLIAFSFYYVFKAGNECKSILEYTSSEENLENLKEYYLEYELIVYGNKTVNKYNYKESYKKEDDLNEYFRFEVENNDFGNVVYEITNNSLKISSNSQISLFNLENYNVTKTNLYSVITFLNMYFDLKDNSDITCVTEYDDYIIFSINFDKNLDSENINPNYKLLLNNNGINISKLELYVSKKDYNLKRYIGYTNLDKACFEINYVKSEIK